ncbi:hypothetical protein H311_04426, partial [Anncaliia algerae PRA109]
KNIVKYIAFNKNRTVENNYMFKNICSKRTDNINRFYLPNMLVSKLLRNTVKHGFYYWKVMVKIRNLQ